MYAWAISGGGSKWAWELGVIRALASFGEDPDIVTGVSAGALHAAKLCQYPVGSIKDAVADLETILKRMHDGLIFEHWYPGGVVGDVIGLMFKKGIYDASPLWELVKSVLDVGKVRQSGRRMSVGCVSLNTGDVQYFGPEDRSVDDDVLVKSVVASASYPAFFAPVPFLGQVWSDGGLRDVTPLRQAIAMGATRVDVICAQPEHENEWDPTDKPVMDQIGRIVGIMSGEINNNDLAIACEQHPEVDVRVFRPASNIGDGLDFDGKLLTGWEQDGYRYAAQSIARGGHVRPSLLNVRR